MVFTWNKASEEWGEIFGDEVMGSALIDRLVHHCHVVKYQVEQLPDAAPIRYLGCAPKGVVRTRSAHTASTRPGGRDALTARHPQMSNFNC